MLPNFVRSIFLLFLGLVSSMMAEGLPSRDEGMRAYSITCLGGKGYSLRHAPSSVSSGVLGAFLETSKTDAVALEIQRRFIGNRGVDDEETELIGLDLSGRFDVGRGKRFEFSPGRAKFALSDSLGRVGGTWKVNAELSRLAITRLSDGVILLGGSISVANVERPNESKFVIRVSCIIPS